MSFTENQPRPPRVSADKAYPFIFGGLLGITVVAVVVALVFVAIRWWPTGSGILTDGSGLGLPAMDNAASAPSASAYSAVFLSNDQVYFGKMATDKEEAFVSMTDVFYLQASSTEAGQTSLAMLGSEMHGPENTISINRDHILYIETLRADSSIVKAIEQSKTAPQAAPQP